MQLFLAKTGFIRKPICAELFLLSICDPLPYLIFSIIFTVDVVPKLYRQIVGNKMITNCASLAADLFLFCYKRDFMTFRSDDKQNILLRHLTQHLDIWIIYLVLAILSFKKWSSKFIHLDSSCIMLILYVPKPAPFLNLSFSIKFVSSKIYDKRGILIELFLHFLMGTSPLNLLWRIYFPSYKIC